MKDHDDKLEGQEESEYHFSDEEESYEVEHETPKTTTRIEDDTGQQSFLSRLTGSKRMLISLAVFLVLVFVVYKVVAPTSTAPATEITASVPPVTQVKVSEQTPTQQVTTTQTPTQPAAPQAPAVAAAPTPSTTALPQAATTQPTQPITPPTAPNMAAGPTAIPPPGSPPGVPSPPSTTAVTGATTVPAQILPPTPVGRPSPPPPTTVTGATTAPTPILPPTSVGATPQTTPGLPPVIPVQTAQPTYPLPPAPPTMASVPVMQPVTTMAAPAPSGEIDAKIAMVTAEGQRLMGQLQGQYTQQINDFSSQNKALQEQMQSLTSRVSAMETQLNQLVQALTTRGQGTTMVGPPVAVPPPQAAEIKIAYNVQAIIPGRAWLKTDNGDTLTVAEGDMVKGVGRVTKIDPYDGVVVINTGSKSISLSYGNGG